MFESTPENVRTHKCKCGKKIELRSMWENECPNCERLYNGMGQEILPFSEYADEYWDD